MITLTCDNCDKPFQVEDDAQPEEKVACPYCGDINRVPSPAPTKHIAPPRGRPVSAPDAPLPRREVSQSAQDAEEHDVLIVRQAMFRAHPALYTLMMLLILCGLGWAVAALGVKTWPRWHMWCGLAIALAGMLWWLVWWGAPHRWVKLVITNKRTIRQEGIIQRETSEVLHRHIRNVQIKQTVLQRVLGVGSIAIDSAAGGGDAFQGHVEGETSAAAVEIRMDNVANPYDVKAVIDKYRGI